MSGHSKWSQIKRQKGVADARRGQLFSKLTREIMVAARQGGGDPTANGRLRLAVKAARDNNMPLENIERAIKRSLGGAEGVTLEEITYEGYGPGGCAILVQALTDNRNRSVADIRNLFTRSGGSLAEAGAVNWLFESKGLLTLDAEETPGEELALAAIDAGAEDVNLEESASGGLEIYTTPEDLEEVRKALEAKGYVVATAEVIMQPKSLVTLDNEQVAAQALRLLEKLEELDDVQRVFSNADFPAEILARLGYGVEAKSGVA